MTGPVEKGGSSTRVATPRTLFLLPHTDPKLSSYLDQAAAVIRKETKKNVEIARSQGTPIKSLPGRVDERWMLGIRRFDRESGLLTSGINDDEAEAKRLRAAGVKPIWLVLQDELQGTEIPADAIPTGMGTGPFYFAPDKPEDAGRVIGAALMADAPPSPTARMDEAFSWVPLDKRVQDALAQRLSADDILDVLDQKGSADIPMLIEALAERTQESDEIRRQIEGLISDGLVAASGTGSGKTYQRIKSEGQADSGTRKEPERHSVRASLPSGRPSKEDLLGFEPHVRALSRFLEDDGIDTPLTIGIEGDWGRGKSSFLLQLTGKLDQESSKKKGPHFVYFNPWRLKSNEGLFAAYALALLQQLPTQVGFWRSLAGRFKLAWYRLDPTRVGWGRLGLLGLQAVVAVLVAIAGSKIGASLAPENAPSWLETSYAWFAPVLSIGALVVGTLRTYVIRLGKELRRAQVKPDYEGHLEFVDLVRRDSHSILRAYAGSSRVYTVIDDIDRCPPTRVADLVQALNQLIEDPDPWRKIAPSNLVVLMALDRNRVAAALATLHEASVKHLAPDGEAHAAVEHAHAFLNKFIHVSYTVPIAPPSAIKDLVRDLNPLLEKTDPPEAGPAPKGSSDTPALTAHDATADEPLVDNNPQVEQVESRPTDAVSEVDEDPTDSPAVQSVVHTLSRFFKNNPRQIKGFLSQFRLCLYVQQELVSKGRQEVGRVTPEALGKLVAIRYLHPAFFRRLEGRPAIMVSLQNDFQGTIGDHEDLKPWSKRDDMRELMEFGQQSTALGRYRLSEAGLRSLDFILPSISTADPDDDGAGSTL